ncbi:O-antigen ligase family protein, partial [bacterium]|nr:O-antigen ligase family protein [bacterium]
MTNKILLSHPFHYFYSIAGVNRLILFFVFIQQLSCHTNGRNLYKALFTGIIVGTFWAIMLGLCDYYSLISLAGYRNLDPIVNANGIQYRLQSTFGHPGWFAEFTTITIPIILIGFFKKNRGKVTTALLFLMLLLCEITLILAKARAGWISYPLTLFFCWLFFYNSRENTHFSWHNNKAIILKVCISIPVTIILSFLIIFQFAGDSNPQIPNLQQKGELSQKEISLIKHNSLQSRLTSLFKLQDRLNLWGDGIKVGKESPIWGMGYESFDWQAHNLAAIPESHFSKTRRLDKIFDTPHNLYIQLFVSNGIIGLIIWGLLVGSM